MRIRLLSLLLVTIAVVSGCNLSTEGDTNPIPSTAQSGGRPTVSIISPANGSEFTVNDRILVSANATDAVGVTRIQLLADGQIVKTVSSEADGGERNMNAVLDYTPRATGSVNLSVVAYRGSTASDPAGITVTIRQVQPSVTPTIPSNPNPGVPIIDPNDPTCRAVTTTSLNLRTGPDVIYDRISVLASGTTVPIVGRTSTNSWWQVRVGSVFGWLSGQYVLVYGICSNIPVVPIPATPTVTTPTATRTPTATSTGTATLVTPTSTRTPGPADLVISSINGPATVTLGAGNAPVTENYAVTITNTGQSGTGQFSNIINLQPGGSDTPLGVVAGLNPGESILLTISLTFTAAGNYTLQARADSDAVVVEQSEVNNVGILSITVNANP